MEGELSLICNHERSDLFSPLFKIQTLRYFVMLFRKFRNLTRTWLRHVHSKNQPHEAKEEGDSDGDRAK